MDGKNSSNENLPLRTGRTKAVRRGHTRIIGDVRREDKTTRPNASDDGTNVDHADAAVHRVLQS